MISRLRSPAAPALLMAMAWGMLLALAPAWSSPARPPVSPRATPPPAPRAVLVPLDDRPSTLLFVLQVARIGGAEIDVPPRSWLGSGMRPGEPERVTSWLRAREVRQSRRLILSSDMLCYGGLVASRAAVTPLATALERLRAFDDLSARGARLHVFATVPRLALRTSERQAPYEYVLARWAAGDATTPPPDVPADIVDEYLGVRQRNLQVLLALLDRVEQGRLGRLVIGQDDSSARGLHHADQQRLLDEVRRRHLEDRVMLMSGADELAMDMVAGWLADESDVHPRVAVVYSDPHAATLIPPLESQPLEKAVADHLRLAGARSADEADADVLLFVQTPATAEATSSERTFPWLERAARALASGRRVGVADLSYINRADPKLAEALIEHLPLHRLECYAAWNTPSNKLGTAVAQLVTRRVAQESRGWPPYRVIESEKTHLAFLLARLVDDYRYQAIVREKVRPLTAGFPAEPDPLLNVYGPVALEARLDLVAYTRRLFAERFLGRSTPLPALSREARLEGVSVEAVLPWQRVFEVELRIDVRLELQPASPVQP